MRHRDERSTLSCGSGFKPLRKREGTGAAITNG
jgi:hypothetical protein